MWLANTRHIFIAEIKYFAVEVAFNICDSENITEVYELLYVYKTITAHVLEIVHRIIILTRYDINLYWVKCTRTYLVSFGLRNININVRWEIGKDIFETVMILLVVWIDRIAFQITYTENYEGKYLYFINSMIDNYSG